MLLATPACSHAAAASLGTTGMVVGPLAGTNSVVLAAGSAWVAATDAPWLHLDAANQSGAGSTNVLFSYDANNGGTRTR